MPPNKQKRSERARYVKRLFSRVPLYTTRLVKEGEFPFPERVQITTPEGAAVLLQEYFAEHDCEEVLVALMDAAGTITGISSVSEGGLTSAIIEPRQVFKTAVLGNAASIILAHNHPSGNPEPSRGDLRITRRLVEAGKVMGIPVRDHLIIGDRGYTSLAQRGVIS